uniref:Transposase n=1 Tax=Streptomyces sp. NBC_01393 TaxID=2903851 RepID=A0AAU3HMJ4_9ACTN
MVGIEKVVPREKLAEALAVIAEAVPDEEGDEDAEWWAALAARYSTMRGFIRLLVDVVYFGSVQAGTPVVNALKQLPHLIGRKKIDAFEVSDALVGRSWRRLVFAAPGLEPGLADKAAYSFCVVEHLHRSLRRNARDYERLPQHSQAHLNWSLITLKSRHPCPATHGCPECQWRAVRCVHGRLSGQCLCGGLVYRG